MLTAEVVEKNMLLLHCFFHHYFCPQFPTVVLNVFGAMPCDMLSCLPIVTVFMANIILSFVICNFRRA